MSQCIKNKIAENENNSLHDLDVPCMPQDCTTNTGVVRGGAALYVSLCKKKQDTPQDH